MKRARIPAAALAAQSSSGRCNSRRVDPLPTPGAYRYCDDRASVKTRHCLSCREPFRSVNAGNRICSGCIARVSKQVEG
ncbi:hypothetical protein [Pelagibius sp.]|uniref:hypothetical protein n=1 Tax=Pelagibius sp. TaxID=1931238 RepID=UPI002629C5D7|nr:hypothetical protein [Pelagibius sp.]